MSERQNAILTIIILCSVVIFFALADVFEEDRFFSETENRVLAKKPKVTQESLLDGSYTKNYEKYVSDQFVSRDTWIAMKTKMDLLMQKKELNGIYIGKDGYLMEKHDPEDYTEEQVDDKLKLLKKLKDNWNIRVMLVPTADYILTDKLPKFAPHYDENILLEQVKELVGEYRYIDVSSALKEHADQPIYYKTDHHWTSLGAFYAYQEWADTVHVYPLIRNQNSLKTVTNEFLGTLHSRVNLPMEPDVIQYFPQTAEKPIEVIFDFTRVATSMYEPKHLETKNKYGYFLDDNHAFIEIHTSEKNGRKLFVIKDSYANSMIPLLTNHYEYIYVMDPRYYNGKLFPLMEQYGDRNELEVLVLYNCIHFLEDFKYY